jgi:hypothetical protein
LIGRGSSSLRGGDHAWFQIGLSAEKEISAHRTPTLRASVRAYAEKRGALPIMVHIGRIIARCIRAAHHFHAANSLFRSGALRL